MMTIAEQWVQEGRQEGLNSERQLLLRQLRRRFGEAVVERSRALLERVEETVILEELGEALLDCADGEAWLALLARRIGWICRHGERLDLPAQGEDEARCPATGERYRLSGNFLECME